MAEVNDELGCAIGAVALCIFLAVAINSIASCTARQTESNDLRKMQENALDYAREQE